MLCGFPRPRALVRPCARSRREHSPASARRRQLARPAWHGGGGTTSLRSGGSDTQTPTLNRALAELAPCGRSQVVRARPADVAAAVTFPGVAVARPADDDASGTAGKAFDPARLHERAIRHDLPGVGSLVRGRA